MVALPGVTSFFRSERPGEAAGGRWVQERRGRVVAFVVDPTSQTPERAPKHLALQKTPKSANPSGEAKTGQRDSFSTLTGPLLLDSAFLEKGVIEVDAIRRKSR